MTQRQRATALILLTIGTSACGGSNPAGPSGGSALTEQIETPAHVYRFAAGDSVDVDWQESYHSWAIETLGLQTTRRITYNKYRSRQHMGEVIGVSNTNGWADPATYAIHTIWPVDNHEVVHLYSTAWGSPVALFSEGLAVAYSVDPRKGDFLPRWHSQPVHVLAQNFHTGGTLIALARIAETNGFRSFDSNVTYPQAGSFVRYLIDTHGLDPMRQVFAALRPSDSAARVNQAVTTVYGRDLAALESEWIAFLVSGR